jgi:hypothetical protein
VQRDVLFLLIVHSRAQGRVGIADVADEDLVEELRRPEAHRPSDRHDRAVEHPQRGDDRPLRRAIAAPRTSR